MARSAKNRFTMRARKKDPRWISPAETHAHDGPLKTRPSG